MKKFRLMRRLLAVMFSVLTIMQMGSLYVYAAETEEVGETQESDMTQLNQIMVTAREVELKAEPNYNSETLMTYEKGASVFVTELVGDEWVLARYQDKIGYVDRTALLMQKMDVSGIDAEMAVEAEETKFVLEEVERYQQEARRSKIWGTIIVVLVISIFAIGIISTIRAGRNKETDEERDEMAEKRGEDGNDISLNIEDLDKESEEENK